MRISDWSSDVCSSDLDAKLWGVIAMFASIALLFFLPWLDSSPVKSSRYRPLNRIFFWVLVADVLLLGVCGKMPAEQPWVILSQIGAAYYFAHFLVILPIISDRKSTRLNSSH